MKKRITTVKLEKINISYMCGEILTSMDITADDINSSESECELCGSHGSTSIWINTCPQCGKYHDILLKEW
jgi:hypothetical protein